MHFEYKIIPAGRWSRIKGTTARGGDAEPRPHLIPITEVGKRFVHIDATQFIGRTGLVPGEVTLDNGETVLAYRFIALPAEEAPDMIAQLDAQIAELERAARD